MQQHPEFFPGVVLGKGLKSVEQLFLLLGSRLCADVRTRVRGGVGGPGGVGGDGGGGGGHCELRRACGEWWGETQKVGAERETGQFWWKAEKLTRDHKELHNTPALVPRPRFLTFCGTFIGQPCPLHEFGFTVYNAATKPTQIPELQERQHRCNE